MLYAPFYLFGYALVVAFWIFILYVLSTIAKSLKAIDASTREIAQALRGQR